MKRKVGVKAKEPAEPTAGDRAALNDAIELTKQARLITMALGTRKLIPAMKIGNPDYSLQDAIRQLAKMKQIWDRDAEKSVPQSE